jgi:predicted porin
MNMMSKKILGMAIAAALAAPFAAQADVKLSGTIQAEIGSLEISAGERFTNTSDGTGALYGGGPNRVGFDFDEDLSGGLTAYGRIDWAFNTTNGGGSNLSDREKYVGLKGFSGAYLRVGRIQGAYKTATKIDPFASTSGQMRTGGGESIHAFTHGSYLNNIFEIGFNNSGLKVALQGVFDDTMPGAATGAATYTQNGSYLANVEYSMDKTFTVFGAYSSNNMKFDNPAVSDTSKDNWKVGGKASFGGLTVGLQYEVAETNTDTGVGAYSAILSAQHLFDDVSSNLLSGIPGATLTTTPTDTQYLSGSVTYGLGNVVLGGWVARSSSELELVASDRITTVTDTFDVDATSFAVGAIYLFSKKTLAYAAYHSIDVDDTKIGDLSAFAAGIRHSF